MVDDHGSAPYKTLMRTIFNQVSGDNARVARKYDMKFRSNVENAQKLMLLSKRSSQKIEIKPIDEIVISGKLDDGWIAGMVGAIPIRGSPPVLATLNPADPLQIVAIRAPSRGLKDGTLSDARIEVSIAAAKAILTKGVSMKACPPPIESLSNSTCILQDDEYFIKSGKNQRSWNQAKKYRLTMSVFQGQETDDQALVSQYIESGVDSKAAEILKEMLDGYGIAVARRLLTYINANRAVIEVARLSKEGGGTLQPVVKQDSAVCKILLRLCFLYPSAIERMSQSITKFKVKTAPIVWKIAAIVRDYCTSSDEAKYKWHLEDSSGRTPKPYQLDALEEMSKRHRAGKKGHFLWIPAGLGKTMIAMLYLSKMTSQKYVIYSLPKSAIKSIIQELTYFGAKINLMLPIKAWKKHPEAKYIKSHETALVGHINLIEHDHLRVVNEHLLSIASQSIVVMDEVHKALNDTKRTSVALEICRLSLDFIAMTGTPIIDSNTYKLIWWLEQIVEFSVNDANFWVAANGMIARKVNTGVVVDSSEVEAEMTAEQERLYKKLVPVAMGGSNKTPSQEHIRKAFDVCYEASDGKIVDVAMEFVNDGKGVMVVAQNTRHQEKLATMFETRLSPKKIHKLGKDESIFMTDETVANKTTPDYKIVIVPMRKSEGYTLTRMRAMVTGVYPSNNATREQLAGRINRVSQKAKTVHYRTVHCGILSYVLKKHAHAASLSAVLSAIAKEI
jgi:superfamily II DNA or RNA helicase